MEMSAIAGKNIANMAHHDWLEVFHKTAKTQQEKILIADHNSELKRDNKYELWNNPACALFNIYLIQGMMELSYKFGLVLNYLFLLIYGN